MTTFFNQNIRCLVRCCLTLSLIFFISFIFTLRLDAQSMQGIPHELLHLDTEQGLSHSGVTALMKDSRGYMWIATYDGLCRYNGNKCTIYKNRVSRRMLVSNRVRSLYEAPDGRIWAGTDLGISIYDYTTDDFVAAEAAVGGRSNGNYIVRQMHYDSLTECIYCFTEWNGVLVYDQQGKLLRHDQSNEYGQYGQAVCLAPGAMLLGSNCGLYVYDCRRGEYTFVPESEGQLVSSLLLIDEQTMLWGRNEGVQQVTYAYDDGELSIKQVSGPYFTQDRIVQMTLDAHRRLWLGTAHRGAACLSEQGGDLKHGCLHYFLDGSRISGIAAMSNGLMWISTFDNGVFCYSSSGDSFREVTLGNGKQKMKSPCLVPFGEGQCFVRAMYDDLRLFDLRSGRQLMLPSIFEPYADASASFILGRVEDKVLLISGAQLLVFTKVNGLWRMRSSALPQEMQYSIMCCALDATNRCVWVGYTNDLCRIRFDANWQVASVESIHDHPNFSTRKIRNVRAVMTDSVTNTVWVGTESQGLYQVMMLDRHVPLRDVSVKQYKHIRDNSYTLSSNFVSAFVRHPNGTLYVGTEQGGFCRVDESKSVLEFKTYSEQNGLSNNVVKSLICDDEGALWIATNVGLNRFDVESEQFRSYRVVDGLPFEEYWYHVSKMADGSLVYSGVGGVVHFDPRSLDQSEELPNVELVNLSVLSSQQAGEEVGKQDYLLRHTMDHGKTVELDYDQHIFTVGVDVLYERPSSNHFIQYQLLPTSSQWITLSASTDVIAFNGLPSGRYSLRVRASNFDGQWTDAKLLNIVVKPPFYRTPWAYLCYVLFVLAVLYLVMRAILRFKFLRQDLQLEVFKKEQLEAMNEEKQRYFSNISHELKTPLTLISAPVEVLIERFRMDEGLNKQLQMVRRQANKMLQLVDSALSSRLEELNLLQRQNTTFAFHTFLAEMLDDFTFMARYDRKELVMPASWVPVFVNADRSMMEKILNNLLNNAFKYTRDGDRVTVDYRLEDDQLVVSVADTGYGIDPNDLPRVFERFYQGKKAAHIGGTGIGLAFTRRLVEMHGGCIEVESQLNEGTIFTVTLPVVALIDETEVSLEVNEQRKDEVAGAISGQIIEDVDMEQYVMEKKVSNSIIYVVEDNVMMRDFLVETMSRFFHVRAFANGQECLDAMEDSWPGLIVSDVMMPVMDGYELCSIVKTNLSTSHIPVILLTACGTVDERVVGFDAGADSYIPKPFHTKHLLKRIETLLSGRIMLSERYQLGIPLAMGDNQGTRTRDNEFLERLFKIYAENMDNEEMDIDSVSELLGVSRSALFQKVKALTNSSPALLFRNYKLKRAADMLVNEDVNVNEVCFAVGFKSRSTFSRLFKEKYGVSPSKYATSRSGE